MRGRKGTSNHRRIKRRTIRSRKHQNRRKTFKKGGYGDYGDYVEYTKSDNPTAVLVSNTDWQAKYDKVHKDDDKLKNDPAYYRKQQQQPFNPYDV